MNEFVHVSADDAVTPELERLVGGVGSTMQSLVQETSDALTPYVRQNAPVGHYFDRMGNPREGGQLKESLRFVVGQWGAVLEGAPQGVFVISGTVEHDIYPRRARALAFYWEKIGQSVAMAHVNHPGTKANDFRQKGLQEAIDEDVVTNVSNRVLEGWVVGHGTP